jgi:subtilisin family serine protease
MTPLPPGGGRDTTVPSDREDDRPEVVVDWLFPLLRQLPPLPRPSTSPPPVRIVVTPGAEPRRVTQRPPPRHGPPRTPTSPPPPRATPAPIAAATGETVDRVVVVALAAGADRSIERGIATAAGVTIESGYDSPVLGLRLVRLRVPAGRPVGDVLAQLAQDGDVISAQPEFVFRTIGGAGAARSGGAGVPQYAVDKLRLAEAHRIATGRRVRVAVIDTALDALHPELEGAISGSFNALGEPRPVPEAHGTAIAGILAARASLKGIAPAAEVLSASAFKTSGEGGARSSTLALVKAIDWALASGARVVNMSFAGPEDPLLAKAIAAAAGQGLVLIAAAGNAGPGAPPAYPAAWPEVIAVTASDATDRVYAKANRGSYVAVAAPGVDIMAPAPKESYEIGSGTSMAAAHVSGVVALLIERDPTLTTPRIRTILGRSARKPADGGGKDLGAGIVDAAGALASHGK